MSSKLIVTFYKMKGCGHCVRFEPTWNELKKEIEKIGGKAEEYDSSIDKDKIQEAGVTGFPTIMIKYGNNEEEYKGNREVKDILNKIEELKQKQSGGGCKNDYYKLKYLKYKAKYMKLKML